MIRAGDLKGRPIIEVDGAEKMGILHEIILSVVCYAGRKIGIVSSIFEEGGKEVPLKYLGAHDRLLAFCVGAFWIPFNSLLKKS